MKNTMAHTPPIYEAHKMNNTMVDAPPSYEAHVGIPQSMDVQAQSVQTERMTESEKSTNQFLVVYSAVMSALFFVYGLGIRKEKFQYDPFGAAMACGVINAISVIIGVWRAMYNVSNKDARTIININGLAGLGLWIYMIIILDSSDGALLKADHASVYALMFVSVIFSGTAIGVTLVVVCLMCCMVVGN